MSVGGVSSDELLAFIKRIENLEVEKKEIQEAIREVYSAAATSGFEPGVMRQIVRLRKMDAEKFKEQEVLLAVYKKAIGMSIEVLESI